MFTQACNQLNHFAYRTQQALARYMPDIPVVTRKVASYLKLEGQIVVAEFERNVVPIVFRAKAIAKRALRYPREIDFASGVKTLAAQTVGFALTQVASEQLDTVGTVSVVALTTIAAFYLNGNKQKTLAKPAMQGALLSALPKIQHSGIAIPFLTALTNKDDRILLSVAKAALFNIARNDLKKMIVAYTLSTAVDFTIQAVERSRFRFAKLFVAYPKESTLVYNQANPLEAEPFMIAPQGLPYFSTARVESLLDMDHAVWRTTSMINKAAAQRARLLKEIGIPDYLPKDLWNVVFSMLRNRDLPHLELNMKVFTIR